MTELRDILSEHRAGWNLPKNLRVHEFIDFLKSLGLQNYEFKFLYETVSRYTLAPLDDQLFLKIVASLKPKAYLSHYSALFLNQLTKQNPILIYVNSEQPTRPAPMGNLLQSNIDRAFKAAPRTTNNFAMVGEYTVYLLNGKNSGNLGVIETGDGIKVTNIERTLIDATVRPAYSGGVIEVLKAYEEAKQKVSVKTMKTYLKKLDFVYPYHQAIGFYLERAGYNRENIKIMESIPKKIDFYLANQMQDTAYSERWKLYYPKSLDKN
jgi:predicted transcriptional regulator of viral defense system